MSDIAQGWAALEAKAGGPPHPSKVAPPPVPTLYRHYRPLADAVGRFVREAQDTDRIFLGIEPFDREMRGIGRGHLCLVVGYNHSGKTLLLLHVLRHNRDKRVAMFIPDEPQALVLAKLASIQSGVSAVELERRVASGDEDAIRVLRETAAIEFPNLIVFDKPMVPGDMHAALKEAEDVWEAKADLVVVDFLDLVQAGETVQQKMEFVKGFGSSNEVPMIVLHQTSRSAGAEGRKINIDSGAQGGEAYATFQIGVRRKKNMLLAEIEDLEERVVRSGSQQAQDRLDSLRYDLAIHTYTLSANLNKNKRPGGSLVDEIDFELFGDTGQITYLPNGTLPAQYLARHVTPVQPSASTPSWVQTRVYDDEWFNPYEDT